jgi:hypothetical protein
MPDTWHDPSYLAGSSYSDEAYVDVRPYTEPGNPWINASYCDIVDSSGVATVYRKYANVADPEYWSAAEQINAGDAGYALYARPRLCYSPGAPGTGAGCAFISAGWDALKWNSPWYGAVEERPEPGAVTRGATVIRGVLSMPASTPATPFSLFDPSGRRVMTLQPGENDVRALPRGVYYVREGTRPAAKVVLQ